MKSSISRRREIDRRTLLAEGGSVSNESDGAGVTI
jgi:hypothetical protein